MSIQDMSADAVTKAIMLAYPNAALDFALNLVRNIARETENKFITTLASDSIRKRFRPHVSRVDVIIAAATVHFGVTEVEICGTSRLKRIVRARRMVCWLLRERLKLSVAEIGARIRKDHSTVVYACDQFEVTDDDWILINQKLDAEAELVAEAEAAE